jgi:CubicO group peptidase (beta-lactamase class C family)
MYKHIFFLTFLVFSTRSFALDTQAVNSIIENSIKTHQTTPNTGISISVFTQNSLLTMKGYGFKDQDSKMPVTPQTLFAIGSTTKAFTALDLKILENNNQLKLTDKIQSILPYFRLSNEMISEEASIEDLLSHRIGLPRHDILWYLSPFSRRELIDRLPYLDFPEGADDNFRKTFQYNNLLLTTAGVLVEEKAKVSWEEFTQKNILDVLGMSSTFFGVPKVEAGVDLATPYSQSEKLEHRDLTNIGPAGSIYSNAEDMTKWVQSFMQKKWPNQEDFFHARIPLINGEKGTMDYSYGLCWMINTMNKQYSWYFHGGNIDGFSTLVLFSHDLDLGIVIMVNQNKSPLPDKMITDILLAAIKEKNQVQEKSLVSDIAKISFYNPESLLPQLKMSNILNAIKFSSRAFTAC